jgi:AcrR family transcriptional regulator
MNVEDNQTRTSILDATLKLVGKHGISAVTMAAVAKAAGVTRQTVYFYFGSRSHLMTEMMRRRFLVHPLARQARELTFPPASIAKFEEFVRIVFRFMADVGAPAFAEWAQAVDDKAVLQALRERTDATVAMTARMMADLKRQGLLQPGWTAETAAEWVNLQAYPTNYYALAVVRKWPLERIVERTLEMLRRDLLASK